MAKDTITVDGEERVVREDTARSYRGVVWALLSVLAFVIITALVFFSGLIGGASDGDMQSPRKMEEQRR